MWKICGKLAPPFSFQAAFFVEKFPQKTMLKKKAFFGKLIILWKIKTLG